MMDAMQLKETRPNTEFLNSENPTVVEDNFLFLILLGSKSFHPYLIAD